MTCCRCKMLKTVQSLAFAVHETVLYLDSHPHDIRALEYYRVQKKKLDDVKAEFESKFGPLTHYGIMTEHDSWQWVKGPWPWEYAANVCTEQEGNYVVIR